MKMPIRPLGRLGTLVDARFDTLAESRGVRPEWIEKMKQGHDWAIPSRQVVHTVYGERWSRERVSAKESLR